MPKSNKEIEKLVLLALDSLSEQYKPNIKKTAREFAVPEGRLRRRWKGGKSLFNDNIMVVSLALYKRKLYVTILITLTRSEHQ